MKKRGEGNFYQGLPRHDPRRWARGAAIKWGLRMFTQWRRSVVKHVGKGKSGQAIKLFQITPYVSDFQTLKNSGS